MNKVWPALAAGLALWAGWAKPMPEWSRFRGPNGSGVLAAGSPPARPGAENLAWRVAVPEGLSSPVLGPQHLYLTGVEGGRLLTLAYDRRTGRLAWKRQAPEVPLEKVHPAATPAASTPCVDQERVYVYFGSYGLIAYTHQGEEAWSRSLPTPQTLYGTATSPVLNGDRLIVTLDDDRNLPGSRLSRSRLLAVDRRTGETVWETGRPRQRSSWSTPTIWVHPGGRELVVFGSSRVCGYDAASGAELWWVDGFSREVIAVPIVGLGRVYVSAARLGGGADEEGDPEPFWQAMLRFDGNEDGRIGTNEITRQFTFPLRPELPLGHPGFGLPLPEDPKARLKRQMDIFRWVDKNRDGFWTREELAAHLASPRGKPRLVAIRPGGRGDVSQTHLVWEVRRGIPEIPSPILVEGRIYMIRNGGVLTAVEAVRGEVLFSERIDSPGQFSASPVAANGLLYLGSNRGRLTVVRAADRFTPLHQTDLEEGIFATPALDADTLYIRTERHLVAFRSSGSRPED